ncbi:MAG: hypothetical protein K6A42_05620 [Treponema sp.]|nr:hypothetical protein [Treponema sp.]
MKIVLFGALLFSCAFLFSCLSTEKNASEELVPITVEGTLQSNDVPSYFIIYGEGSKNAKTFFFEEASGHKNEWKDLKSLVGKNILIHGNVLDDKNPWLVKVSVLSAEENK